MVVERARQTKQARRALFTAFRLWTVCPSKMCGRHKACRGDANRCLQERWQPLAPPEVKALLQKAFAKRAGGMTPREAVAAAAAETSLAADRRQDEAELAEKTRPFVPTQARALPNDRTAKERESRGACPREGGDWDEQSGLRHPRAPRHRGPRVRQL
jgi:hypothetical protein